MIVFDDVFIPWERIFMDGESEFASMLVERFTCYHRRSYVCKTGVGDVLIGAAATVADYNGVEKVSHIRDKLVEMTHLNETIYGTGVAASYQGVPMKSGVYIPDEMLANVCKHHVTKLPYEIGRLAQDLAGGLMVTMPSEKEFRHPELGALIEKYLEGPGRHPHRGPHAHSAPDREHDPGPQRGGLSHRVHARRRLPAGSAHPDRPRHADRVQEATGEDACRNCAGLTPGDRGRSVDIHGAGLCAGCGPRLRGKRAAVRSLERKGTMTQAADAPSPQLFLDTVTGYQRTEALRAAVELDLFTAIGEGRSTVAALAQRCATSEKGMRVLCDYLTVAGFLVKQDARYGLTASTATFLDRRSPAYMGGMLEFLLGEHVRGGYANLLPAIKKGGTVQSRGGLTDPEHPGWVTFARVMMPMMAPVAHLAAQLIDRPSAAELEVLDIAAGHGLYGIEVGKRFPQATITGLDWPRVLEVAQENAQRAGLAQRYRTIHGDAFQVELGSDYDVVLIPNFLHHFGFDACVSFLRKVNRALKPDGIAVTVEFVPNADRVSPPFPATFAMSMLALTAEGDAYPFAQLDAMLKQAGFARNTAHALEPTAHHAVISRK